MIAGERKEITLLNESRVIDTYIIYLFIRKLTKPFEDWLAFDLGIIDEEGNILKSRKDLKTKEEKEAFTVFDLFILKMKKLLSRLPFGRSKIASYAAALYFIRESEYFDEDDFLFEDDNLCESFEDFYSEAVEDNEQAFREMIDGLTCQEIEEIANVAGSGAIAGVGDGTVVVKNRDQTKYLRRNREDGELNIDKIKELSKKIHNKKSGV